MNQLRLQILFAMVSSTLLWTSASALAQSVSPFAPDKMDSILYGVAYYTEYMPYERLDKDVEMMQQAG
ncbi:MAG TPA: hypothetical protein VNV63_02120, partial [Nitrospiria bacterium]|nr:hypothetical protein [Nitrospiria bacterium]